MRGGQRKGPAAKGPQCTVVLRALPISVGLSLPGKRLAEKPEDQHAEGNESGDAGDHDAYRHYYRRAADTGDEKEEERRERNVEKPGTVAKR